jgi:hypothetical protein
MNRKITWMLLWAVGVSATGVRADTTTSPVLMPGNYTASIMPPINHEAAVHIEENIAKLPGLSSVDAHSSESTIKFTVQKDAQINTDQIRKALETVDEGAVMSTPVLDHAYNANPGL